MRDDPGMDADQVHAHCLAKPGAVLDEPWPEDHVVKVGGKIFAFLGADTVGVKCGADAEQAAEWRARYPGAVRVSPYIGRYGWNVVALDGAVPDQEIVELLDGSYDDVVRRLPKGKRPA